MEIFIVYCVLSNIKVNVGRKVTCAVHTAHWEKLENIVSTILLLQQCGRLGREEKIILK